MVRVLLFAAEANEVCGMWCQVQGWELIRDTGGEWEAAAEGARRCGSCISGRRENKESGARPLEESSECRSISERSEFELIGNGHAGTALQNGCGSDQMSGGDAGRGAAISMSGPVREIVIGVQKA